jgi:hypothetical protein
MHQLYSAGNIAPLQLDLADDAISSLYAGILYVYRYDCNTTNDGPSSINDTVILFRHAVTG